MPQSVGICRRIDQTCGVVTSLNERLNLIVAPQSQAPDTYTPSRYSSFQLFVFKESIEDIGFDGLILRNNPKEECGMDRKWP